MARRTLAATIRRWRAACSWTARLIAAKCITAKDVGRKRVRTAHPLNRPRFRMVPGFTARVRVYKNVIKAPIQPHPRFELL